MRQQPTNETAGLRPVSEGQPPYLYPDYAATRLRAPKKPLIILPKTLSGTTGPAYGRGPIGELDNDLTRQHEGEPLGERIIVTGRVTDGDGSPVRNSLIEIWQANRRRARPRVLSGFGSAVRRPGALPVPRGSIGMITRDTVELHHLLEGPEDAPVLVLSNSLGTTLAMWDEQAHAFAVGDQNSWVNRATCAPIDRLAWASNGGRRCAAHRPSTPGS